MVFLESNENEKEDFYSYFEKNENNIAAFEIIKELIAEDKKREVCPEFVGTEEDIMNLPKYSLNYYGCIELRTVVKRDLDIEKLKTIKEYYHAFYKGVIRDFIKN